MDTVLVPVDFSACAPEITAQAASFARRIGGRVLLLHVVEVPGGLAANAPVRPAPDGPTVPARQVLADEARALLPDYEATVRDLGVHVQHRIVPGEPAPTILDVADDEEVDYIALGTHGRKGLSRMVLGSVAEQVLRRARVPVLTFRTHHKASCDARSCAWCASHVTRAVERLRAEADG